MEFFKGIIRKKVIGELGLSGQFHKDDFVGPEYLRGDTFDVQPAKFLDVVEEKKVAEVTAKAGRGSDTHVPYDIFAEVDPRTHLYIKTEDDCETLFPELKELGFEKDGEASTGEWSIFKRSNS